MSHSVILKIVISSHFSTNCSLQKRSLFFGTNEFSEMPFDLGNMTDLPDFLIRNEMSRCPSGYRRLEMGDFMANAIR